MSRDAIHRIGLGLSAVAIALLGVGCTQQTQEPPREAPAYGELPRFTPHPMPTPPENRHTEFEEIQFGRSVGNRPLVAQIYGDGSDTVLIMASIHGNETAGTPLVHRLGAYLLEQPQILEGRRVILVPVTNPDGAHINMRKNLRGVDLNRNFPAGNYRASGNHGAAALSEPESRALVGLIDKYAPRRIISIHQPMTCIDYDGAADGLARLMAGSSGLPLKKIGSLPGSLGSYAGTTRHIPIVTVELPRQADDLPEQSLWNRYGRMLLLAVCYPDAIPAEHRADGHGEASHQSNASSRDTSARSRVR